MGCRQSNIELCRIVSIVMVMLLHSDFAVFGWPKSVDETTYPLVALESFCIIGVNVFVLITGYFSTTIKKRSLFNLFYICFFYWALKIIYNLIVGNPISISKLFFVTRSNWFIPAYLGLLLFTPALNAVCKQLTRKQLLNWILALLFFELYMSYFPAMPQLPLGYNHGCSVLSFITLYLVARYIGIYGEERLNCMTSLSIYIVCSLLIFVGAILLLKIQKANYFIRWFDYNNPIIILSSISLFLFFTKLKIKDNMVINRIAKSVLAVLLVHASSEVISYTNPQYLYIFNHYSGIVLVFLWMLSIVVIYSSTFAVDQLRIILWNKLSKTINKQ